MHYVRDQEICHCGPLFQRLFNFPLLYPYWIINYFYRESQALYRQASVQIENSKNITEQSMEWCYYEEILIIHIC